MKILFISLLAITAALTLTAATEELSIIKVYQLKYADDATALQLRSEIDQLLKIKTQPPSAVVYEPKTRAFTITGDQEEQGWVAEYLRSEDQPPVAARQAILTIHMDGKTEKVSITVPGETRVGKDIEIPGAESLVNGKTVFGPPSKVFEGTYVKVIVDRSSYCNLLVIITDVTGFQTINGCNYPIVQTRDLKTTFAPKDHLTIGGPPGMVIDFEYASDQPNNHQ